jgi:DNA repair exonuclease SbcCD ATPase subunit
MLHLAQVQNNKSVGGVELRLLARQHSENSWAVINPEKNVPLTNTDSLNESSLVLVDLSNNHEVLSIQPAKEWVLGCVQQYLTIGVSPAFLQEEAERTEQWRQDLTLLTQDVTRQRLETEARREQIQALEEELRRMQQQLEEKEEELKIKEEKLKNQEAQLRIKEEELRQQRQQLEE